MSFAKGFLVAGLIMLGACMPATSPVAPTDTSAVIEFGGSGPWQGSITQLYPDDVLVVRSYAPGDGGAVPFKDETVTTQLRAGAFVAVRDHVLAQRIPKRQTEPANFCADYGGFSIRYAGPDREVVLSDSVCPDERISKLHDEIQQIISRYDPKGGAN